MPKNEAPVYSKKIYNTCLTEIHTLSEMLQVKNYKSQRQKLISLRKLLHTLDQSYGINFRFRYGKLLLIMHLKQ